MFYKNIVSIFEYHIDDKKVDCNGYGEDFEYKTFDDCYITALSEATAKKHSCLVPWLKTNESLLPICKSENAIEAAEAYLYSYER